MTEVDKDWVHETVSTLTAEGWRRCRFAAEQGQSGCESYDAALELDDGTTVLSWEQLDDLLAHRNEVAAGLSEYEAKILLRRRETCWLFPPKKVARALSKKALVRYWANDDNQAWTGDVTPFGREVARVLEADNG